MPAKVEWVVKKPAENKKKVEVDADGFVAVTRGKKVHTEEEIPTTVGNAFTVLEVDIDKGEEQVECSGEGGEPSQANG